MSSGNNTTRTTAATAINTLSPIYQSQQHRQQQQDQGTQTITIDSLPVIPTLRLVGANDNVDSKKKIKNQKTRSRVTWAQDTIDNEDMGKKKSKSKYNVYLKGLRFIYHPF